MRGTQLRLRHLVGAAALSSSLMFGALTFASLPAGAQSAPASMMASMSCPNLSVGNPNPGDNLIPGAYIISGEAFDPAAPAGTSGVSRVDVFLGLRDQGGTILGSAVPGDGTANPRFFSVEVTVPTGFNRGTTFAAYALSSITGQETTESFPVFVGTPPKTVGLVTPTPVPQGITVTSTCPAGVAAPAAASAPAASASMVTAPSTNATPATAMGASTGTTATGASTTGSAAAGTNACPVLSLANPNPGDSLTAGDMFISGTTSGPSGVSRVDLFLGERDQGGLYLGSGVPGTGANGNPNAFNVEVTIPNLGRGLDFAAYAVGNNGQETAITFPVFVGSQLVNRNIVATPTPVPTTETTTSTCH
jgi:hypothetical protein